MKSSTGKVRKRKSAETKRRKLRETVVKMLDIMESNLESNPEANPESTKDPVTEFLVTGRTGRRNAMADILGPHASVTSGDLPERLQSLTTVDSEAGPSSSCQSLQHPAESSGLVTECHTLTVSSQDENNKPKSVGNS